MTESYYIFLVWLIVNLWICSLGRDPVSLVYNIFFLLSGLRILNKHTVCFVILYEFLFLDTD